ncbi:MAG: hypothetical protein MR357_07575 [Anaeroplasma sp.]|nr:hypothetical protein [Anaeroplasma sp.]
MNELGLEKLRKTTKIKLIIMSLSTLLPIIILLTMDLIPNINQNSALPDLIIFRYGILALLEGYIGVKIYIYIRILANNDFAEAEVIKRNDERNKYIKMKSYAMTIKVSLYLLGIALIVTAFINRMIFYTLLGVLLAGLIVYFIELIYYANKY